jgi:hypothetical protein
MGARNERILIGGEIPNVDFFEREHFKMGTIRRG